MPDSTVNFQYSAITANNSSDLRDDTFERYIREAVRTNGYLWVMALASEERDNVIAEAHSREIISVGPHGRKV